VKKCRDEKGLHFAELFAKGKTAFRKRHEAEWSHEEAHGEVSDGQRGHQGLGQLAQMARVVLAVQDEDRTQVEHNDQQGHQEDQQQFDGELKRAPTRVYFKRAQMLATKVLEFGHDGGGGR